MTTLYRVENGYKCCHWKDHVKKIRSATLTWIYIQLLISPQEASVDMEKIPARTGITLATGNNDWQDHFHGYITYVL